MSLWPKAGPTRYQTSHWPRLGHFYTQENHEKSKSAFMHNIFWKYQKSMKNTRSQKDFKTEAFHICYEKLLVKRPNMIKNDDFGQHMSLWPKVGLSPYQTTRWPRFGHFYTQENHEKSKNGFKFLVIEFNIQEEARL